MKLGYTIAVRLLMVGLLPGGVLLAAAASDTAQTVSGGGVTVKVRYLNPGSGENPRFKVVLDTHSVGLDGYDLKSLAVLRDSTGKNYSPTAVENTGSGHHREVHLVFPKVAPDTKQLEVAIKDIAGVKERVFRWELK